MSDGNKRGRPGLGRGLNALLGEMARETPVSADGAAQQSSGVRMLPVSSLSPHPDQPRRHFDEAMLDELAASIASRGLIQPIDSDCRPLHGWNACVASRPASFAADMSQCGRSRSN